MSVPHQFANATGNINLVKLDQNFDALGNFSQTAQTVIANAQPNVASVGTLVKLDVTGNIRSLSGYILGDGRYLTNLPTANINYGDANVLALLPAYVGNLNPSIITAGNVNGGNLTIQNTTTLVGPVTAQQMLTVYANVNSYGIVVGKDFITATGNANVINVNATNVSTTSLSATGLVTVGTLVPNVITGNGNIFAHSITANANLAVGGRITCNNVVIANQGFSTNANLIAGNAAVAGNTTSANVTASGNVSGIGAVFSGNVSANYFIGDGSKLINIGEASYGNSNVRALGNAGWGGNIIPAADSVYSLGNVDMTWSSLSVQSITCNGSMSTDTINLGTQGTISLFNAGGDLAYDAFPSNFRPMNNEMNDLGTIFSRWRNIWGKTFRGDHALFTSDLTTGTMIATQISATGNIAAQYLQVTTKTIADARGIAGQAGQMISLSDSVPNGKFAYWDTTNNRWSYFKDDSAV